MKGKVFLVTAVAAAIALAILGLALIKDDAMAQSWETPPPRDPDRADFPRTDLDIGDTLRWDFTNTTPTCEDDPNIPDPNDEDPQGWTEPQWFTQTTQRGLRGEPGFQHKGEDFGLTINADHTRISGRLKLPPKTGGSHSRWVWRPDSSNSSEIVWRITIKNTVRSDADHPDKPGHQCYFRGGYSLYVTYDRPQPPPTNTPVPIPDNTPTPVPTIQPTQEPGAPCIGNLRFNHWHGTRSSMTAGNYNWTDHRNGNNTRYGDTFCMSPDERETYGFNKTGVRKSRAEPSPHDHVGGANEH